jgi:hypothetical protein
MPNYPREMAGLGHPIYHDPSASVGMTTKEKFENRNSKMENREIPARASAELSDHPNELCGA